MAHTSSHILAHLIFSTKNRHTWITDDIKSDLHAYQGGIIKQESSIPLAIAGIAEHVHLLLRFPPRLVISDLVRKVKTNSSGWIHDRWPTKIFQWQPGYAAFSVSESNRDQATA